MSEMNQKTLSAQPSEQEKKLLDIIRALGYGEILIKVKDGKPIRAEEIRKSVPL